MASNSPTHREDELGQLIEGLERITRARPMIVVVDDAHFADETLVRVVDGLVREGRGRVLVVATGWPSHLDATERALPFAVWAQSMAADHSDRCVRYDLGELADDGIEEIVRAELPAAAGFSKQIRKLYGTNLLAIRAVLRLPRVRRLAERWRIRRERAREAPEGRRGGVQRALGRSSRRSAKRPRARFAAPKHSLPPGCGCRRV